MQQGTGWITGNVDVGIAVVIEIASCHAHSVERHASKTGFLGDILELAATEIPVQCIANGCRTVPLRSLAAGNEEQVFETVFVKIEEGDATAHGFDQISVLRLPVEMAPVNS